MPAVTNFPMRRWLSSSHLPISADRSGCVPSPLSPVSGPVAGLVANGMRFRVRALHSPVSCSLDGGKTERLIVRGFLQCVLSSRHSLWTVPVRAPFLQFFPCSPSVTRSVLFPRPAALRCSASFATANALRVWVSNNKFPAQHARGCGPVDEISCRSLHRKHISALGAGHLTSLRAGVSRGSSGQKPTWRKSSWHSTKTASA